MQFSNTFVRKQMQHTGPEFELDSPIPLLLQIIYYDNRTYLPSRLIDHSLDLTSRHRIVIIVSSIMFARATYGFEIIVVLLLDWLATKAR